MRNLTVEEAVKILRNRDTYEVGEGDFEESLHLWADASGTIATAIAMGFYDVVPASVESAIEGLTRLFMGKKSSSQVEEQESRDKRMEDLVNDIFGDRLEEEGNDDLPGYNE